MRSSAKPFQALPLAVEAPDLPDEELAIACASHDGAPEHLAAVNALLARAGCGEDDLECGPERGSRLNHNCSGKHAGMLLLAKLRGWPHAGLPAAGPSGPDRAGRRAGRSARARGSGRGGRRLRRPDLRRAALRHGARVLASRRGELLGSDRVTAVMRAHPVLSAVWKLGIRRSCSRPSGVIAKRGAEGLMCAVLPDGTGVAAKVEDGANRAAGPGLAAFLGIQELDGSRLSTASVRKWDESSPASEKQFPFSPGPVYNPPPLRR